jgi:hypothetical protein
VISTFTAVQSLGRPATTPATDCPTVPPDKDHTGICVEPLDMSTSEGWPVAIDRLFALRKTGECSAPKLARAEARTAREKRGVLWLGMGCESEAKRVERSSVEP